MFNPSTVPDYLPADYIGFGSAFEAAALAEPFGFEAWAINFDHIAAQCEVDSPGCTADVVAELIDKAERRGAIAPDLANGLRAFFELP